MPHPLFRTDLYHVRYRMALGLTSAGAYNEAHSIGRAHARVCVCGEKVFRSLERREKAQLCLIYFGGMGYNAREGVSLPVSASRRGIGRSTRVLFRALGGCTLSYSEAKYCLSVLRHRLTWPWSYPPSSHQGMASSICSMLALVRRGWASCSVGQLGLLAEVGEGTWWDPLA